MIQINLKEHLVHIKQKDELALLIPSIQAFYYDKVIEECENDIIDSSVVLKGKKIEELMVSFRLLPPELMKYMSYERGIGTEQINN